MHFGAALFGGLVITYAVAVALEYHALAPIDRGYVKILAERGTLSTIQE